MPDQLDVLEPLADRIHAVAKRAARPVVVALDGRSGAGKSTMALGLGALLDVAIIAGDDFYAGGIELRSDTAVERACACIDWTRQRPVLEALRNGRDAIWRAFD
jgi:uridine kinase